MSKDPAFLFYDGDAAKDVSHMNRLERGCYFDLIQAQRKFHGFTVEQARKILGKDFDECWGAIELILSKENDVFFIEWVRNSIIKRQEGSDKQRERIQNYWNKKKEEEQNHGNTTVLPKIVNENEIENVIEDKKEKNKELRETKFVSDVYQYTDYPKEMLQKFISYWTEPNKSKTKMRWELEKVFDISRRLITWASRDKDIAKTNTPKTYEEMIKLSETNPGIWEQYTAVKKDGERKAVFYPKT